MAHTTLICNTDDEDTIIELTQQINPNAVHLRIINKLTNKVVKAYIINTNELVRFAHLIIKQYGGT
jgi:hypothetical protein